MRSERAAAVSSVSGPRARTVGSRHGRLRYNVLAAYRALKGDVDMTLNQLERRISALEERLERLDRAQTSVPSKPWWRRTAGRFANDPMFEEIVRLGREYRESLDSPKPKRKRPLTKGSAKTSGGVHGDRA